MAMTSHQFISEIPGRNGREFQAAAPPSIWQLPKPGELWFGHGEQPEQPSKKNEKKDRKATYHDSR